MAGAFRTCACIYANSIPYVLMLAWSTAWRLRGNKRLYCVRHSHWPERRSSSWKSPASALLPKISPLYWYRSPTVVRPMLASLRSSLSSAHQTDRTHYSPVTLFSRTRRVLPPSICLLCVIFPHINMSFVDATVHMGIGTPRSSFARDQPLQHRAQLHSSWVGL